MFCVKCGKELSGDAKFCGQCGQEIVQRMQKDEETFTRERTSMKSRKVKKQTRRTAKKGERVKRKRYVTQ